MPRYSTIAEAIARCGADWPKSGQTYQDLEGKETFYSYADIERLTAIRAKALQDMGLQKGDRVGLVVVEPEHFVLTFFACLRVGVLPVPLYPPLSMGGLDAYQARTSKVLTTAGATVLIASARLQNVLWSQVDAVPTLRKLVKVEDLAEATGAPAWPEILPEDMAFLQYTSGSTSDPKGVMVTHASLVANCVGIMEQGVKTDSNVDVGVSWLPLYHDMGLIGFVIAPICYGVSIVFIPTMRFVKRPTVWFDAIHKHRGTLAFAPNFAYALVSKKATPEQLAAWDLSCIRYLGCGAEPVNADTMRDFTALFGKAQLPTTAVKPAYGMAEATLCMSLAPEGEAFTTTLCDAETFQGTGKVVPPIEGKPFLEHVSCGTSWKEHELATMGDDGTILPEGQEGEIVFRGASVTPGYFRNPSATAESFRADGWLKTGDLGYVLNGQIHVTGRLKDLIIFNGRNIHPQSVEWLAAECDGVRKGNVVAFSIPGKATEELVVACEVREGVDADAIEAAVKQKIQAELGLTVTEVVCLAVGTLPKTSSGKLQRRLTRQQFLDGSLGASGNRIMGATGSRLNVAKHVAKSLWTRAKAAANLI